MERRAFLALLTGGLAGRTLEAHAQSAPPVVAFVALASRDQDQIGAFLLGLRENGLLPGVSVRVEERWANGDRQLGRRLVGELVAAGAAVYVAAGVNVARMIQERAKDAAIVVPSLESPEAAGAGRSLPRPQGNVTGFATLQAELIGKRLQFLREVMPALRRVVLVINAGNMNHPNLAVVTRREAEAAGFSLIVSEVRTIAELAPALGRARAEGGEAVLLVRDFLFESHRREVAHAALEARLPSVFDEDAFVAQGGLMSYSPNRPDLFRRSAAYVARILAGTPPSELPIQQPTKFDLAVNLKTAKALGLVVPPSIIVRASEVIE